MTRAYTKHTPAERISILKTKFIGLETKKKHLVSTVQRFNLRIGRIADKQQRINNTLEKMGAFNAPVA